MTKAEKIAYFNKKAQNNKESGKTTTSKAEKIAYFNKKAGRDDVGIGPYSNAKSAKDLVVNNSLLEKYGKITNFPEPLKYTDTLEKDKYDGKFLDALRINAKQAVKSVGTGLRNALIFGVNQMNEQTKYDPAMHIAENAGLIKKGFNEEYGKVIDKQTENANLGIAEDYKKQQAKNAEEKSTYASLPKWQQVTAELVGGSAQLIPQIAVSAISPMAGTTMLGGQVFGNSYAEALAEGATKEEATGYGMLSAGTELAIEKAFGGIPLMGKGFMNKYISKGAAKLVSSPTTQKIIRYAADAGGEGLEEVASTFLSPFLKRWTYDINAENPTAADYLMAFSGGFVGSAIFGGANLALDLSPSLENDLEQKQFLEDKESKLYDKYFESHAEDVANNPNNEDFFSEKTLKIKKELDDVINKRKAIDQRINKRIKEEEVFDTKKSGDFLDGEHTNMNSIRKESPDNNIISQDENVVNNTENNSMFEDGVRFNIKRDRNGNKYWEIESEKDIFKGLATKEQVRDAAYKFLLGNRDNKVVLTDGDGNNIEFIRLSADEFTYGRRSQELYDATNDNLNIYEKKMRMIPSLQDILLNTSVEWDAPDHKAHTMFKEKGFKNYRSKVRVDNVIFNTVVRVGKANFGNIFYDINLEVDTILPHANSASEKSKSVSTSANNIPQNDGVVNNYNMQNTENNAITNELNFARENASGIEVNENDSRKMKLAKKVMRALNERYGVNFKIYSGESLNGFYHNGTVYINKKSEKPILSVIGHEFLHGFKDIDAEGYALLKSITESDLRLADYERYKKNLLSDWKEAGIDISALSEPELKNAILEEAMSDMMGEIINDPETIRKIALEDKNLAERIMAYLKDFIEQIRTLFDENDAEIQSIFHNYEQVKAVYQEVVAQSNGRVDGDTVFEDGAKFSVEHIKGEKSDYGMGVVLDTDIFQDYKTRNWGVPLRDFVYNKLAGKELTAYDEKGNPEKIYVARKNDRAKKDGSNNNHKVIDKLARYKGNNIKALATAHLPEIVETSKMVDTNNENSHQWLDENGWRFYKSYVSDKNGKIYELILNVADGRDRKIAYDINQIDEIDKKIKTTGGDVSSTDNRRDSHTSHSPYDGMVPQNEDTVNSNNMQNGKIDASDVKLSVRKGSRAEKAQRAMEIYEESGNVADLPSRQWAKEFNKAAINTEKMLENKIATAEWEKRYAKNDEQKARLDEVLAELKKQQKENVANVRISGELIGRIEGNIERNYNLADIINDLKDVDKGLKIKSGNYRFNDFYRNFERVFGKHFDKIKPLLDRFDDAKGNESKYRIGKLTEQYDYIVKQLGIKKGSKESKAVQWIAEGERNPDAKNKDDIEALKKMGITDIKNLDPSIRVPYTEAMLRAEFGEAADNILKAEQWYRNQYDEMINAINATQRRIYPNRPEKLLPKRKDYMRHFREVKTGLGGLLDLIKADVQIAPGLVSVSEHTSPKEKWASFKQKRAGKATSEGAIEGFNEYIGQASYAIYINPYIEQFRGLARDLAELKSAGAVTGTDENGKSIKRQTDNSDLNGFIEYLNDFANDLAGKTGGLDRALIKSMGASGRTVIKALQWFNNRTKANAVLGNVASMSKQIMNIPNGITLLKNPANILRGIYDAGMGAIFKNSKTGAEVAKAYKKSNFLTSRYADKAFSKFEKNGLTKGATFMLGLADEIGTRSIWNALYYEAVNDGEADPIRYADVNTRKAVAGRGIGEIPLAYKSQLAKLALPFQIEPTNSWNVMRDMISGNTPKGKLPDYGDRAFKTAVFFGVTCAMNAALEALTGSKGSFDPLGDMIEGLMQGWKEEEEENVLTKLGTGTKRASQNVAGDFIGSRSFGWVVGELLDTIDEDWATNYFNDSLYQAQGVNIPAIQSATKAFKKAHDKDWLGAAAEGVSSFALPFGGKQLDKTFRGIGDVARGGNYQSNIYKEWSTGERGDMYYPIEKTTGNYIKAGVFGPSSLKANNEYWENKKLEGYEMAEKAKAEEKAAEEFFKAYKKENPDSEVVSLYNEIKRKDIFPFEPVESTGSYTHKKVKTEYTLTDEDRAKYQKLQNEKMQEKYNEVFKSTEYKYADAQMKRILLEDARSAAKSEVKEQIKKDHRYGVIK